MKKITIYDVADEAGVSLATVSRVINGSSVVKPETRERVLATIQRLDFKPNQIARGLATSKTTTIATVFPQSLFAHVKDMIGGIGDTSRHLDYNISMYTTDDLGDGDPIEDVMEKVIKSRADGVVLFNNAQIDKELDLIKKYKIPTVVIGKKVSDIMMGSIYVDGVGLTEKLITEYLEKGITDIAFVSPEQNLINNDDMVQGIKNAFSKKGLVFDDECVIRTPSHYEQAFELISQYISVHKPKMVFCGYDKEAVAVVNAAKDNNLSIPEDMEVIGMMNTSYSIMSRPAISSINVPVYDMGALAIRLLTKILHDEEIDTKEVKVSHLLIPRKTTK